MTRLFRTILLLTLLVASVASPAQARLVVGVTPTVMPGAADRATIAALEQELTSRMGEAVQVRSFDSEATQLDWLIRFRELDAALVSRHQAGALPSGTTVTLADISSAVAVSHPGMAAGQIEVLRRGFRSLTEDDRGRQLLHRLAGIAKAAVAARPAPLPRVAPPAPAKPAATAPAARPPAPPTIAPAPATPKPAVPVTPSAPAVPSIKPAAAPTTPVPQATAPTRSPLAQAPVLKPRPPGQPAAATPPADAPAAPKRTRLLLIAALVVLVGIVIKITLLMRHWGQRRQTPDAPPQPPSAATFDYQGPDAGSSPAPTPPAPAPPVATTEPASNKPSAAKHKPAAVKADNDQPPPDSAERVVEQGRLGRTKVPALLKRCADLPQPVILHVRTHGNETCVHFAAGQICHAYSRNWQVAGESQQWSKLGYLMVREGLISEAQCDQALELTERQEGLRLPAALQQLGIFDVGALRHILARQAKTTLFALILFSSGEYSIEADNGVIPAEESISLQVEELIREASHHQAEWTAIRKVLPTLGTLLDFAPDGRDKLDQVRLSAQQQLLLSQVNGQTPLGALCNASTMMDYEVTRFLYLMVKAGVLQVVPAG